MLRPKVLTFHLLSNRAILSKLRTDLGLALPDANAYPSLKDMEQLPYLSAVISEGLRYLQWVQPTAKLESVLINRWSLTTETDNGISQLT